MGQLKMVTCPSCGAKLKLPDSVSWNKGYIKCPACTKRGFVTVKKSG